MGKNPTIPIQKNEGSVQYECQIEKYPGYSILPRPFVRRGPDSFAWKGYRPYYAK
jgi:hypothetical protein